MPTAVHVGAVEHGLGIRAVAACVIGCARVGAWVGARVCACWLREHRVGVQPWPSAGNACVGRASRRDKLTMHDVTGPVCSCGAGYGGA